MPRVSEFFGIVIAMFHADHAPAHFHASYCGHEALIGIDPLRVFRGALPPRALALVVEWAARHRDALMDDWLRARLGLPLEPIPPLD